jgi:hypothetical protein
MNFQTHYSKPSCQSTTHSQKNSFFYNYITVHNYNNYSQFFNPVTTLIRKCRCKKVSSESSLWCNCELLSYKTSNAGSVLLYTYNNINPRRYSSDEPWPAEQLPLAVFPDCTRRYWVGMWSAHRIPQLHVQLSKPDRYFFIQVTIQFIQSRG